MADLIPLLGMLVIGAIPPAFLCWKYRLLWQESEKRYNEVFQRGVILSRELEHATNEANQAANFAKALLSRPVTALMTDEQVMRIGHAVSEVVKALTKNPAKLD